MSSQSRTDETHAGDHQFGGPKVHWLSSYSWSILNHVFLLRGSIIPIIVWFVIVVRSQQFIEQLSGVVSEADEISKFLRVISIGVVVTIALFIYTTHALYMAWRYTNIQISPSSSRILPHIMALSPVAIFILNIRVEFYTYSFFAYYFLALLFVLILTFVTGCCVHPILEKLKKDPAYLNTNGCVVSFILYYVIPLVSLLSIIFIAYVSLKNNNDPIIEYGSLFVYLVMFLFWILALNTMNYWLDHIFLSKRNQKKIPLFSVVVVWYLLWSFVGFNDHYWLIDNSSQINSKAIKKPIQQAVKSWQAKREAGAPIYVVAAQGGGAYAAYHTVRALIGIQRVYPQFANSLFAISSVSGGSVGALQFNSLLERYYQKERRPYSSCSSAKEFGLRATSSILKYHKKDILAPVLGAGLTIDLLSQLNPFVNFNERRAEALKSAISKSWKTAVNESWNENNSELPLLTASATNWSGVPNKLPFILFNATAVETGQRVIISPFIDGDPSMKKNRPVWTTGPWYSLGLTKVAFDSSYRFLSSDIHLSMLDAAVVSALFPLISPAVKFSIKEKKELVDIRLTDGGIADNTGIRTALQIVEAIKAGLKQPSRKANIKLILLTYPNMEFASRSEWPKIGAPLTAAMNARIANAHDMIAYARSVLNKTKNDKNVIEIPVSTKNFLPRLGWTISNATRKKIDDNLLDEAGMIKEKYITQLSGDFRLKCN